MGLVEEMWTEAWDWKEEVLLELGGQAKENGLAIEKKGDRKAEVSL